MTESQNSHSSTYLAQKQYVMYALAPAIDIKMATAWTHCTLSPSIAYPSIAAMILLILVREATSARDAPTMVAMIMSTVFAGAFTTNIMSLSNRVFMSALIQNIK